MRTRERLLGAVNWGREITQDRIGPEAIYNLADCVGVEIDDGLLVVIKLHDPVLEIGSDLCAVARG